MPLLSAIIFLPALAALVLALLPARDPRTFRNAAAAATGMTFLLSLWLFAQFDVNNPSLQFVERVPWVPAIGFAYLVGVDGLSLPFVVLTALLSFCAVLGSWRVTLRPKEYFVLLLILETGITGVFGAQDLALFFLFWEVELAPMFLLIGIWGGPRREYAAIKFVLYTLAGSAAMLVGILVLYFAGEPRTFAWSELVGRQIAFEVQLVVFVLIFFAFVVKLPGFPFHTWLPDAHVEAPTAVSVLLAGVLLKMGGYGIRRLLLPLVPEAMRFFAPALALLAVVNVLYGALLCLAQSDMKKLVAYSSISHMGYVLLGIAALTTVGLGGAVLQMVSHGFITGLLFLLVGVLYDHAHTRDVGRFGGLVHRTPALAVVTSLAALAALGLPGMSGFVAEYTVFVGSFATFPWHTAVSTVGVLLAAGYMLWMTERIFFGPLNPEWHDLDDAHRYELVPLWGLIGVILLVGLYPPVVTDVIDLGVGALTRWLGG
ncbi:MAG: NADH-quinone oxidoreductase subunit M [Chloroflexi bacterium]|nr:NADH-quinone oxidoreductase subunit M [Chloroflexota bacterium]